MTAARDSKAPNIVARKMELSLVSVDLRHGFRWSHKGKCRSCQ